MTDTIVDSEVTNMRKTLSLAFKGLHVHQGNQNRTRQHTNGKCHNIYDQELCLQQRDQLTLIESEETGFKEIFREEENFAVGLQKWPQVIQINLRDYFRLTYF